MVSKYHYLCGNIGNEFRFAPTSILFFDCKYSQKCWIWQDLVRFFADLYRLLTKKYI